MEEIYWITRLDSISETFAIITIISGIVSAVMTVVCNSLAKCYVEEKYNESWANTAKNLSPAMDIISSLPIADTVKKVLGKDTPKVGE